MIRGRSQTPGRTPGNSRPNSRAGSRPTSPTQQTTAGTNSTGNSDNGQAVGMNYVYDRITEATNRLTDFSIEPFDGTGDIDDWFRRYEDLAIARRWDELGRKEQLPTFFTGTASRWLAVRRQQTFPETTTLRSASQTPWAQLTWEQVRRVVSDHYLPGDYRDYLRGLLEIPQRRDQDLISFYDEKVYTANRLGRSEAETISVIKRTLLPEYQKLRKKCPFYHRNRLCFGTPEPIRSINLLIIKTD